MKTVELKVIKPPKEKWSWSAEILKAEIGGGPLRFAAEDAKRIYPLLSRDIKIKCPDAVFKTDIVSEPGFLLLFRIA